MFGWFEEGKGEDVCGEVCEEGDRGFGDENEEVIGDVKEEIEEVKRLVLWKDWEIERVKEGMVVVENEEGKLSEWGGGWWKLWKKW